MRHTVERIVVEQGRPTGVVVRSQKTGQTWTEPADHVVANVTVQNLVQLLGEDAPQGYARRVRSLPPASGAFVVYLGVDARAIPAGCPPHLQFLYDGDGPIGENNSLFVSVSRPDDGRAPTGQATIVASSFTDLAAWERGDYAARKQAYREQAIARLGEYFDLRPEYLIHVEAATPAPLPTSPPAIAARSVGWGCG
jgi:phytoene dehydrogenase-like protein